MVREAIHRYRMNPEDAHYLGGVVQPNKHLDIYGDLGTELCVLKDGDESLFLGYDYVEFLAPVYEGDYIECRGKVVKLGNSSRTCEFETYKVATPALRNGKENAAVNDVDVLDPPVLVAKAKGTLIVKKNLQRGDQPEGIIKNKWD
ncbi:hotdog domain-containing protein [Clostridium cochlearium]|uniref:3-aminobutyryl-CoA ammonia-lyase n=1 Tax=Clostridium cochlearium TaxID=1494 RepID=A0A239ZE95_CLOCO|nr:hotdog domain-containing protein [Clostridium cochlearium]NSJ92155.1 beta-alanyl-CoA:ammonia lyase [Coprococcus sp. MSK.21.13]MBE6063787.1 beta-alanyl-CoA:ammonia lyase [Clostridium cochlearium]MBU5269255.1 beta-alanyl-CoA:ammonia lyase [Clostridium cochlearium]MCG4571998.1 beta-alanyl-CoA:ammonia lyase [Clostridium cochlearium]MCG4579921.1 beta-alanyl-CoA:ammonia lyase [Clostridium cochlearium]